MILLYLQTQAVRTGSREVALGRSMRDWMERMGLAIGGETARSLKEQAARIDVRSPPIPPSHFLVACPAAGSGF
jgi:hypothetical protein